MKKACSLVEAAEAIICSLQQQCPKRSPALCTKANEWASIINSMNQYQMIMTTTPEGWLHSCPRGELVSVMTTSVTLRWSAAGSRREGEVPRWADVGVNVATVTAEESIRATQKPRLLLTLSLEVSSYWFFNCSHSSQCKMLWVLANNWFYLTWLYYLYVLLTFMYCLMYFTFNIQCSQCRAPLPGHTTTLQEAELHHQWSLQIHHVDKSHYQSRAMAQNLLYHGWVGPCFRRK